MGLGAFRGSLAVAMGKGGPPPVPAPAPRWRSVLLCLGWLFLDVVRLVGEALLFVLFVGLVVFVGLVLVVGGAYAARLGWNLAG